MDAEWDEKKSEANRRKHGVSFEEAVSVLLDPLAVTFEVQGRPGEVRELTVGSSNRQRLLLVVHVEHRGKVRLISAREVTKRERRQYEEGI